ncbi:DUF1906 domain-containing protein [Amycolatopsis alkalitolerans]|uniref:DUF1906 domain-containing protein n=1 Tax=Amycolatopsis alkalitolerans TaxID=2547244 RepID=A0A5C4M335_9PSEU|nr:DUF1906 domain-containing protein [Amycolatopsis alkalitolerans]TNC27418.1 DUF1906 domain-containing protein [Amycolatopsis alkalitolerans]
MGLHPARALRPARTLVTAAAAFLLVATGSATADAAAQQHVSYLGLDFSVPADWPVLDLTANPHTCVRFDQHAVYLGVPGPDQDCPSGLVGRTEALLVQPSDATATTSVENSAGRQITATRPGVTISAAYGADRALVTGILSEAGLPAPTPRTSTGLVSPRLATAGVPSTTTNGSGEGFDACSAPSSTVMSAWRSSYSNVGIYLGGSDMACTQPNLTADWVSTQAAAGWSFMPIYVGPQAAFGELTDPSNQAVTAAQDAIAQATNLGFGPGSVLYYDMEAYSSGQGPAALAFEAAWNSELHKAGYLSGIYGAAYSTVQDLVANYGNAATPDVAFVAKWDNTDDTSLPVLPSAAWANHQRVHQYSGNVNETHGGYTLNIDKDVLDVGVAGAAAVPVPNRYVPAGPTRLLDTRNNGGTIAADSTYTLPLSGVPSSVTAVVLNVTVTNPTDSGYLTVYPDGSKRPTASNLNFVPGQTVPNLVTVPVTDGKVSFYNRFGTVDVIADLFGYYTTGSGNTFTPAGPTRLLDTRNNGGTLGADSTYTLPLSGVPSGVTAVVLNVTVTNPTDSGYLTVYPDGTSRPTASNLNFVPGQTVPNLVIVPVTNGKVDFYNRFGTVDVIADLFGYYTTGSGNTFTPAGPTRLLDTRSNSGTIGAGGTYALPLTGVPASTTAVVLNVTATNPTDYSFLTVYPDGTSRPTASNLNYVPGQTVPNLVIVPVTNGKVDFYNRFGTVDVIADLFGYFTS